MKLDKESLLQIATVILVIAGGGGNAFLTQKENAVSQEELRRAVAEVHELHSELTASIERQKEILERLKSSAH